VPGALSVSGALTSGALTAASVTSTGNVTAPSDIIVGSLARSAFTFVDSNPLLVGPNGNTNAGASFRTAGGAEAFIQQNANGTAYIGTVTSHPLALRTANADRLKIDTSGFVTTPYCPSFRVGANSSFTGNNTIHLHASELHDIGNNYNPSNGRFTAPVAGSYYFGVQLISALNDTSTEQNINLRVNNTPINDSRYQGYTNGGAHLKTVVVLSVGDYVTVANGNADTTTYAGGFHNQFMGYLIG
jgi:hypothetical protein